jgi:hypothetical protein
MPQGSIGRFEAFSAAFRFETCFDDFLKFS